MTPPAMALMAALQFFGPSEARQQEEEHISQIEPLPTSTWTALVDRRVEIVLGSRNKVTGTVLAHDDQTVTLVGDEGTVQTHDKVSILSVVMLPSSSSDEDELATSSMEEVKPTPVVPGEAPLDSYSLDTEPSKTDADRRHWARGAAIAGYALTGTTLIFGIAAEATNGDAAVATSLGSVAVISLGVGVPVVQAGSGSARQAYGVRGRPGMRIASWVTYGLGLSNAVVLLGLGIADADVPPGVITSVTLLGITAGTLASTEALIASKEAEAARTVAQNESVGRLRLSFSRLGSQGQMSGAMLGITGRF